MFDLDAPSPALPSAPAAPSAQAVSAALRNAAMIIRVQPRADTPAADRAEFFARFARVNAIAVDAVREALAVLEPGIGWLDLESVQEGGGESGGARGKSAGGPDESAGGGRDLPGGTLPGGTLPAGTLPADTLPAGTWWVCDPIDGAVQLLQGIELWSISLALIVDGVTTQAWVYDPVGDESFHAVLGGGAIATFGGGASARTGQRMHASGKSDLADAFVATSHAPDQNHDVAANARAGSAYTAALNTVGAIRNLGPTSLQLAYVAAGRIDAFWAFGADRSNWIAGALLASEAGAVVTDAGDGELSATSDSILVSAPKLHAAVRHLLQSGA